jgi:hypothetical protein
MSEAPLCYICRRRVAETRDHIPPKSLFPKPRPSDLITAPCCFLCNNRNSRSDEYFRLMMASSLNATESGQRAWKRVLESTIPKGRIKKWMDKVHHHRAYVQTPYFDLPAGLAQFKARPIRAVLIRCVKGLLHNWDPKIDNRALSFRVEQHSQFHGYEMARSFGQLRRIELGEGVFSASWGIDARMVNLPTG